MGVDGDGEGWEGGWLCALVYREDVMMRSVGQSSLGTEWYVMDARVKDAGWLGGRILPPLWHFQL